MITIEQVRDWWAEEDIDATSVEDLPEGFEFADHLSLGGVALLLSSPDDRPWWQIETRYKVQYGDHAFTDEDRARIKLHLRSVFQRRDTDYVIEDDDEGVSVRLSRFVYPEALDRQSFMDSMRNVMHSAQLVSGEVDRFVVGLV